MLKVAYYFLRYSPVIAKRRREMEPLAFQKDLVRRKDAEGFKELRIRQLAGLNLIEAIGIVYIGDGPNPSQQGHMEKTIDEFVRTS